MVTDFEEKQDELLVLLQQRNRILKQLKRKDPIQIRLEQLEQGFTLYVNGAHSEPNNHHKRVVSQNISRRGPRATKGNHATANTPLREEDVRGRDTQSAPSKIQRQEWLQKAVQIKTESGARLHVAPPTEYSEDFEPYESLDQEAKECEQNGPAQAELCMSNDAEKGRLHPSLEDVKELHQSLAFTAGQNRMEDNFSEGEDTDSVEEDVPAEPSEAEGTTEPSRQRTETSFCGLSSPTSGRCCSIASGSLVTLEFKPNCPSLKKERSLSAKRKGSTEASIPTKPKSQVAPPFSAECQRQEAPEIGLSRPVSRSERPLSAARKVVCEKKDPVHSASMVLKAVQAENETLMKEMLSRRLEAAAEMQRGPSVEPPSRPSVTMDPCQAQEKKEGAVVSTAMEQIGPLGNRWFCGFVLGLFLVM